MLPSDIENLTKMLDKNSTFQRPEGQVTGFTLEEKEDTSTNAIAPVPAVSLPATVVDQQLNLPAPSLSRKAVFAKKRVKDIRPRGNELWSQEELARLMETKVPVHVLADTASSRTAVRETAAAVEAQVGKPLLKDEPVYTVLQLERRTAEDVYLGVDFTRDGTGGDGVVVKIEMPKLVKAADLRICVEPFQLYVSSPDYYLNAALPRKCVAGKADATWEEKRKTLEVKLVTDTVEAVKLV